MSKALFERIVAGTVWSINSSIEDTPTVSSISPMSFLLIPICLSTKRSGVDSLSIFSKVDYGIDPK